MPTHLSTNLPHFPKKHVDSTLNIESNLQSTFDCPPPHQLHLINSGKQEVSLQECEAASFWLVSCCDFNYLGGPNTQALHSKH